MKKLTGLLLVALLSACTAPRPSADQTAPRVSLTVGGQGGDAVLTAEVVDPESAIERVVFYRDRQPIAEDTTAPYTYTDRLSQDGSYEYQAYAWNSAGIKGWSASQNLNIKKLPEVLGSVSGTAVTAQGLNSPLVTAPWDGGSGSVTLRVGGLEVGRGELGADGRFTLGLPKTLPQSATFRPGTAPSFAPVEGCTLTAPSLSQTDLAFAEVGAQAAGRSGPLSPVTVSVYGPQIAPLTEQAFRVLVYATRAAVMGSEATCPASAGAPAVKVSVQASVVSGWNILSLRASYSDSARSQLNLVWSNAPALSDAQWVLLPAEARAFWR